MMLVKGTSSVLEAHNVKVVGEGEAIVFAHGFGGDQSSWDYLDLALLATQYKLILFDLRCCGSTCFEDGFDSYEPFVNDLVCILEELHINACFYVGHSMSTMIGCLAAIEKPHLFRKLILLCASPRYLNNNIDNYYGGFEQEDLRQLFHSMESNYEGWLSGFVPLIADSNSDSIALEKAIATFSQMKLGIALVVAHTIFSSDFRSILEMVKVPCHILHTKKDIAAPIEVAEYMMYNLGGEVSLQLLHTNGHLPHLTAPRLFNAALNNILKCKPPSSP